MTKYQLATICFYTACFLLGILIGQFQDLFI